MVAHRHQRVGEVGRARERHVHAPQHAEPGAALDARRLLELARDGLEGLAQQKYAEGARHVRQADADDGVDQPEPAHAAVVLDDQHLRHDHQLQEHQREGEIAPGELEAREGEAGQRAEHELRGEDQGDEDHRVQEVAREGRVAPGALEVGERERRERLEVRGEGRRMERRPEGVEQRREPEDGEQPGGDFLERAHRLIYR